MGGFIEQLLKLLAEVTSMATLFWTVWLLAAGVLVAGAGYTLRDVRAVRAGYGWTTRQGVAHWHHGTQNSWLLPALILGGLLACYIGLIVAWADYPFFWYDSDIFTNYTLKGNYFPIQIRTQDGRFFPLGQQEFNLIGRLTSSGLGYHIYPIFQLLAFACCALILLDQLAPLTRVAIVGLLLALPSAFISFTGLIYPERNLLFWLACLLVLVKLFDRHGSRQFGIAAVLCAHVMAYYKEPASILLIAFGLGRIAIRQRSAGGAIHWKSVLQRHNYLDLWLMAVGMLFLLLYMVGMLPFWNVRYAQSMAQPFSSIVGLYASASLLPWLLIGTTVWRVQLAIRKGLSLDSYWDALAMGAVAYFGVLIALRIYATYFTAVVDFVAILYLGTLCASAWTRLGASRRSIVAILGALVLVQALAISALRAYET